MAAFLLLSVVKQVPTGEGDVVVRLVAREVLLAGKWYLLAGGETPRFSCLSGHACHFPDSVTEGGCV
jgi:hypothetical protein